MTCGSGRRTIAPGLISPALPIEMLTMADLVALRRSTGDALQFKAGQVTSRIPRRVSLWLCDELEDRRGINKLNLAPGFDSETIPRSNSSDEHHAALLRLLCQPRPCSSPGDCIGQPSKVTAALITDRCVCQQ